MYLVGRIFKQNIIHSDGVRESHVVSKTFDVEQLLPGEHYLEDDGTRFIEDIPRADVRTVKSKLNRFTNIA